ncbi:AAA family ATPase [Nocardiopsis sp. FR26]|uniref:AAA family ATPase n=1 Tax=Nocardiopsis sp. FR26 TaxID=2605987 RepID=UPI00135B0922|nr:AAA family ATPase [Nocardiopsis sp. FR26]
MRHPCPTPGCPHTTPTRTTRCDHCTRRTGRAHRITLVCGPPCAGKNTYVTQHAQPGDLVVDLDALYRAINANPTRADHDQPASLTPFALDARDTILHRLLHGDHNLRAAWIIHSAPNPATRAEWKARGAKVVMINASLDTLTHRAHRQRPTAWVDHIHDWHRRYQPGHVDQTVTTG